MKYIIEHLEKDFGEWCLIEYKHISSIVGKDNLIFTNVKNTNEDIQEIGQLKVEKVKEFLKDVDPKKACLLDPDAEKTLSPDDDFDYLVFGGILGDYPPQKRTEKELGDLPFEKRNLGKEQMSTDTAVHVAFLIAEKKKRFDELKFKDEIEIEIEQGMSTVLPYRYLVNKNGEPLIAPGLKEYLKKNS